METFIGHPRGQSTPHRIATKTLTVLGAGLSLGQSLPGVCHAPAALRQAGLLTRLAALGWTVQDAGDLAFEGHDPAASSDDWQACGIRHGQQMGRACELIAQQTRAIAQSQQFCLTLGGDHSIAAGSLSGLLQAHPDLAVVWVDAHGDYNTPDTSPSGNFHGMPLAALTGAFPLADAPGFDFFSAALPPERVALVGVRSLDPGEQQLLLDRGLHVFTMSEIDRYGIGRVMEAALAAVAPDGTAPLHLSLDIDALDPSIAPATGTRVAGGLTYREAHFIAEAMAETGRLVSMDLVEVNPQLATAEADPTLHLAIELVESALGKRILSPRRL